MEAYPNVPYLPYEKLRAQIRSGDILLCSGTSAFSTLIQKATHSPFSHVAFILKLDTIDRIMVLESVESAGVRTIPLRNYVRDYNGTAAPYPGHLMIARHSEVRAENIEKLSRSAIDWFGYPYGIDEIVRIATRISMHALKLPLDSHELKPKREFICSEYAEICFESIGITFAKNQLGFITPHDFIVDKKVTPLFFIETLNHTLRESA